MGNSTAPRRVLVMEGDGEIRNLVALLLRTAGYSVESLRDGAEALHRIRERSPALVVVGLSEAVTGGWELLGALRQAPSAPPVVALAALHQCGPAMRAGAAACLPMPFPIRELLNACEAAARPDPPRDSAETSLGGSP